MNASQFILSSIIIFIIFKTLKSFKRGNLSKIFTIIWLFFWIIILFLIFQQGILTGIANLIGIGRGVDLAIYLSIIIIFYLIYKILEHQNNIDQKITEIIRENAILHPKSTTKARK